MSRGSKPLSLFVSRRPTISRTLTFSLVPPPFLHSFHRALLPPPPPPFSTFVLPLSRFLSSSLLALFSSSPRPSRLPLFPPLFTRATVPPPPSLFLSPYPLPIPPLHPPAPLTLAPFFSTFENVSFHHSPFETSITLVPSSFHALDQSASPYHALERFSVLSNEPNVTFLPFLPSSPVPQSLAAAFATSPSPFHSIAPSPSPHVIYDSRSVSLRPIAPTRAFFLLPLAPVPSPPIFLFHSRSFQSDPTSPSI